MIKLLDIDLIKSAFYLVEYSLNFNGAQVDSLILKSVDIFSVHNNI